MTEPDVDGDTTIWRAVSAHTSSKLHRRRDCLALSKAKRVEAKPRRLHPHADWCSVCTGDGRADGGGSREIYELAKSIGEDRAGAADD